MDLNLILVLSVVGSMMVVIATAWVLGLLKRD